MGAFDLIVLICMLFIGVPNGFRFVDGRWAYLEQPGHKIQKIAISILIGCVAGVFYFVYRAVKFILDGL